MKTSKFITYLLFSSIILLTVGCNSKHNSYINDKSQKLSIESPDFSEKNYIQTPQLCEQYNGNHISPRLHISHIPENTKTLALIAYDPHIKSNNHIHWFLYDINPKVQLINQNIPDKEVVDDQYIQDMAKQLLNYEGPCPTSKSQSYRFALYALDEKIDFKQLQCENRKCYEAFLKTVIPRTLDKKEIIVKYKN